VARFVITFVLVLVSLFTIEMLKPVQQLIIIPFTGMLTSISAGILLPFDDSVIAYGKVLQFVDSGFAVSVEAGCNGVEATIVLIAAIMAFPGGWRARFTAIGLGFLAVQVMNILRIISLFYLGNWNLELFSWVHLYLWPALIMLDVLIVFIVYLRFLSAKAAQAETTHG
jgi:exosortase H (IPTLxxWG-CTERM-specific)